MHQPFFFPSSSQPESRAVNGVSGGEPLLLHQALPQRHGMFSTMLAATNRCVVTGRFPREPPHLALCLFRTNALHPLIGSSPNLDNNRRGSQGETRLLQVITQLVVIFMDTVDLSMEHA